jgi:hypothetical protein
MEFPSDVTRFETRLADDPLVRTHRRSQAKKADVAEHPEVFDHVGLLVNKPPGQAGLLFI